MTADNTAALLEAAAYHLSHTADQHIAYANHLARTAATTLEAVDAEIRTELDEHLDIGVRRAAAQLSGARAEAISQLNHLQHATTS